MIEFQIQNLTINSESFSWWHILLSGAIGSFITLFGTVIAMFVIDNLNKKRWEKDSFQKNKCRLITNIISLSANLRQDININKLEKIENKTLKRVKDFEMKKFEKLYNNLSKLNVFFNEKDKFFIKSNLLLDDIQMYLQLIGDIRRILNNKESDAYSTLKEKAIIVQEQVAVVDYIEFLKKFPNSVWFNELGRFTLYDKFLTLYSDSFTKLIESINTKLDELHSYLLKEYINK